ncbi:lytic transglycosylase domain-containing protein [Nocardioides marmoraquaticus]
MNRKTAVAGVLGCVLLTAPVSATTSPQSQQGVADLPDSAIVATAAEAGQDPVVVPASRTVRDWAGQGAAETDPEQVPTVVLDAYTTAVAVAPESCNITVPVLAAVGQVESGNLVGRSLDTTHAVTPALVGPRLDGGAFASIGDTDNGRLDGDTKFDRAVGPMQFLPSTWRSVGVDMDGDGERDPQNIYDAAGAAMVYLCGTRDLSDPAQLRQAILSYNRSTSYLQQVLTWKETFETKGLGAVASLPIFSATGSGSTSGSATGDTVGDTPGDTPGDTGAVAATRPGKASKPSPTGATGTPGTPQPTKPGTSPTTPGAGSPGAGSPGTTPTTPGSGTPSPSDPGTPSTTPSPSDPGEPTEPSEPAEPTPTYVASTDVLKTECVEGVDMPVLQTFFDGLVWVDQDARTAEHVDGELFPDEEPTAVVDTLCLAAE